MTEDKNDQRTGIIKAITEPIQLFALIVLVIEGLLAYLLSKAKPEDISLYVWLMVGILVLTIAALVFIETRKLKFKEANLIPRTGEKESSKKNFKWDVFLAAPMAALSNDSFEQSISKVKDIKKALEDECGFKRIFFAGANMSTPQDFETADLSVETDVNELKESEIFIMIYPEKIVSSVLYEAGIALALGKPSFYFGNTDNFPFLMKQANQKFNHVKIQEAENLDKILNMIKKNKNNLFKI
jgi:nucleoside 2-deoxyribosyltransferase